MGLLNIFKPLSTFPQAALLINISNIDKFFPLKNFAGTLGIKPGAGGSGGKFAIPVLIFLTSAHVGYVYLGYWERSLTRRGRLSQGGLNKTERK